MLFVYASVVPGVGPLAFGGVAVLQGGHEVSITAAHGEMGVVLHHPHHPESDGHLSRV